MVLDSLSDYGMGPLIIDSIDIGSCLGEASSRFLLAI